MGRCLLADVFTQAKNQAVHLLSLREHSRHELVTKITRKHELGDAELSDLLDGLEQSGYLNDQRFTEMFVRSSIARGHGPMKIAYALRDKGVDESMVRQIMDSSEADWLEEARFQREKKFGEEIPVNFKERARQSRFLAGRGFYIDTINAVFHEKC